MDHDRAFQLFLELSLELKSIPSRCIAIRAPNEDFSSGYRVHVPILGISTFDSRKIQEVVDKNQLALEVVDNQMVIYTPL